jgi:hypothetical protein
MTNTLLALLTPLLIIQLGLTIAMIVSIAKKSLPWKEKWMWLLLIPVATIGPIIYFAVGSSKLDEKAGDYQEDNR